MPLRPGRLVPRGNLTQGTARALVVNSGNANAFTGLKGRQAVKLTAEIAAEGGRLPRPQEVYHRLHRRDRRAAGRHQVRGRAGGLDETAGRAAPGAFEAAARPS